MPTEWEGDTGPPAPSHRVGGREEVAFCISMGEVRERGERAEGFGLPHSVGEARGRRPSGEGNYPRSTCRAGFACVAAVPMAPSHRETTGKTTRSRNPAPPPPIGEDN